MCHYYSNIGTDILGQIISELETTRTRCYWKDDILLINKIVKYCQVYSPDISYCSQFWFMLQYGVFWSHVVTLWLGIFTQQGELCSMAHRFSGIHLPRVQQRIFHLFLSDTLLSKCLPLAWICLFKFALRSLQRTLSCVFSYPVILRDSVVAWVWRAT